MSVIDLLSLQKYEFKNREYITIGGFVLVYCMLASSRFQLPHYIYVVLPFAAIITAKIIYQIYWQGLFVKLKRIIKPFQFMLICCSFFLPFIILVYSFPSTRFIVWVAPILSILFSLFSMRYCRNRFFYLSLFSIISLNIFLSTWFYPQLLTYQNDSKIRDYIAKNNIPKDSLYTYPRSTRYYALYFYGKYIYTRTDVIDTIPGGSYLLLMDNDYNETTLNNISFEKQHTFNTHHVTGLTIDFLNRKTRDKELKKYHLIKIK